MSRSTQWLSLIGGILIFVYGLYKLVEPPHSDWIPLVLGLLITGFSVSKIMKTTAEQRKSERNDLS